MALELASVSSMIGEILIKIGLKMTIFIHEFFGISLDASTVSLYNRDSWQFLQVAIDASTLLHVRRQ